MIVYKIVRIKDEYLEEDSPYIGESLHSKSIGMLNKIRYVQGNNQSDTPIFSYATIDIESLLEAESQGMYHIWSALIPDKDIIPKDLILSLRKVNDLTQMEMIRFWKDSRLFVLSHQHIISSRDLFIPTVRTVQSKSIFMDRRMDFSDISEAMIYSVNSDTQLFIDFLLARELYERNLVKISDVRKELRKRNRRLK